MCIGSSGLMYVGKENFPKPKKIFFCYFFLERFISPAFFLGFFLFVSFLLVAIIHKDFCLTLVGKKVEKIIHSMGFISWSKKKRVS